MATQQKALLVPAKFADFVVGSREIPKPGPGELLVEIRSTSLNPVDWKIHKYGIFVEEYPAVLGSDLAGDVVEVGEGVTTLAKGDRVCVVFIYFSRCELTTPNVASLKVNISRTGQPSSSTRRPKQLSQARFAFERILMLRFIDVYPLDPFEFLIRRCRNSACLTFSGVCGPLRQ